MDAVDVLSAALTPAIAIVATYVAVQQHRIDKARLRHESYDRRLAVFKATMTYLQRIFRDAKTDIPSLMQFYSDTVEADFLFGPEIRTHLEHLYEKGTKLIYFQDMLAGTVCNAYANDQAELLKTFSSDLKRTKELFAKYLTIK